MINPTNLFKIPSTIERFSYRTPSSTISKKTKNMIAMILVVLFAIVLAFFGYKFWEQHGQRAGKASVYYF